MQSRIDNPPVSVPGLLDGLLALGTVAKEAAEQAGLPQTTVNLVDLRGSQIHGRAVCLDIHSRAAKKATETDERLSTLAAWGQAPYFTDPERAALALTEVGTRLADQPEPLPDQAFDGSAKHCQEPALAALIVHTAVINFVNGLNVTTGPVAGEWTAQVETL